MLQNNEKTAEVLKAEKIVEQAKARLAEAKRKASQQKRKEENQHKSYTDIAYHNEELILDLLDKEEIKYRSEKRLLGYRNKGKRRLAGNANQPIIINIDDVADVIDVRAEDEFARVELLVSLKQELERLSPRELMIIRTYLDYPIEVVARKLKVRPNTISKARRKIARELRSKLV